MGTRRISELFSCVNYIELRQPVPSHFFFFFKYSGVSYSLHSLLTRSINVRLQFGKALCVSPESYSFKKQLGGAEVIVKLTCISDLFGHKISSKNIFCSGDDASL